MAMTGLQTIVHPPSKVVLHRRSRVLEVRWRDGIISHIPCMDLRKACSCASCTHLHRSGLRLVVDEAITIDEVRPMGASGLQLVFSDGHDRGLYPWRYLRELGERASA